MKNLISVILILLSLGSCKSNKLNKSVSNEQLETSKSIDTVIIASPENEYEIIIIDPGFYAWLQGTARPVGYYEQSFMETRNKLFVQEWNLRVMQPDRYDPNLYELRIDYDNNVDYGYDVNYKLYNYFIYFQLRYKQKLTQFIPRI